MKSHKIIVTASLFLVLTLAIIPLAQADNTNLCPVPATLNNGYTWSFYHTGTQIISLTSSQEHTPGNLSIQIGPHNDAIDVNHARECDAQWYPVKAYDRIIFECWIKTDSSLTHNNDVYSGARIGIDFYNNSGMSDYGALVNHNGNDCYWFAEGSYVAFNSGWTKQTIDVLVPNAQAINGFIPWLQVLPLDDPAKGYFTDITLRINPDGPTSTPGPTATQPAPGQTTGSWYYAGPTLHLSNGSGNFNVIAILILFLIVFFALGFMLNLYYTAKTDKGGVLFELIISIAILGTIGIVVLNFILGGI